MSWDALWLVILIADALLGTQNRELGRAVNKT